MNESLPLYTERLIITELEPYHAEFMLDLLTSPGWLANIGDRGVHSIEDAERYINEKIRPHYEKTGYGFYLMKTRHVDWPIGTCGIANRDALPYPDIGFAMLPEFQRMGYAFEASQRMLNYAIETLEIEQLCAMTTPNNVPSKNLLGKLGFKEDGTIEYESERLSYFEFSVNS